MQIEILKSFFGTFFSGVSIADEEFSTIFRYLFGPQVAEPAEINGRLAMIIEGLKEVVEENSFVSIEELHQYYAKKTKKVESFLKGIQLQSQLSAPSLFSNVPASVNEPGANSNWSASTMKMKFMPLENHEFLHCIRTFYEHTYILNLRNKYVHCNSIRFQFQGSYRCETELFDRWQHNFPIYNSFKRYFEGFFNDSSQGIIVSANSHKKIFGKCTVGSWESNKKNTVGNSINSLTMLFESIMHRIKKEISIPHSGFKEQLAIWLCYSKTESFKDPNEQRQSTMSYYLDIYSRSGITNKIGKPQPISMDRRLYYNLLAQKYWVILKSPPDQSWLTSDNPGFSVNPERINVGVMGFQADPGWTDFNSDSVIYYPLSRKYCLKIQAKRFENLDIESGLREIIEFEDSTAEELKIVNGLTFSTKKEMVVATDEKPLEQFEMG